LSSIRKWWLLAGGAIALVILLSLLERVVGTPAVPSTSPSTDVGSAMRPEVRRAADGSIEIRTDSFHRTRIRLGSAAEQQALFDCLSSGFDEAFPEGRTDGLGRREVRAEVQRIQDRCMESSMKAPPVPPTPPPPPAE